MTRRFSFLSLCCLTVVALVVLASPAVADTSKPADDGAKAQAASCEKLGEGAVATARCGKCGDGACVPQCGETAASCPIDCGTPSTSATQVASCQRCGDGYCAPSCENERTCPADCRSTKASAKTEQAKPKKQE